jgi:hypothetical protein
MTIRHVALDHGFSGRVAHPSPVGWPLDLQGAPRSRLSNGGASKSSGTGFIISVKARRVGAIPLVLLYPRKLS